MPCIYPDRHPCNLCTGLLLKVNIQCNQSKCVHVSLSLFPSVDQMLVRAYISSTRGGKTEHAQMKGACKLGRGLRWQCNLEFQIHLPDFWAFWADLVTFPLPPIFFSTLFMTPTATVCLISLTAKRPRTKQKHIIFMKIAWLKTVSFLSGVCVSWLNTSTQSQPSIRIVPYRNKISLVKTNFNGDFRGKIMRTRCNKNDISQQVKSDARQYNETGLITSFSGIAVSEEM